MPTIQFDKVRKSFGRITPVDDLTFEVKDGTVLALFGPSGCGKTTALRLLAGFEQPDAGNIKIDNRIVSASNTLASPIERGIGMVFQDLALWPHMRVAKQIEFVLKAGKHHAKDRGKILNDLLDRFDLSDLRRAWPAELSGGEKQRLAIARALATNAPVLLLDEPFSNLDQARIDVAIESLIELKRGGTTMVLASHDKEDVTRLADNVLMMDSRPCKHIPIAEFRSA